VVAVATTEIKNKGKNMKEYNELQKELKEKIEEICELDQYGLSPRTLYANIYHSSGSYVELANIFDVMPSLVKEIKES